MPCSSPSSSPSSPSLSFDSDQQHLHNPRQSHRSYKILTVHKAYRLGVNWNCTPPSLKNSRPPILPYSKNCPFHIQRTATYSKNCSASNIKGRNSIAKQGYLLTDISIIVPEGFKLMPFTIQKNLATQENPIEYQTGNKREIFTRNLWITALDLPQHQSQQTRTTSIMNTHKGLLGGLWRFSSHKKG